MYIRFTFASGFLVASVALALSLTPPFTRPGSESLVPNRAGIFFSRENSSFQDIDATLSIPQISGEHHTGVIAWVGLDGISCVTSVLRAGIALDVNDDGSQSYTGISQFWPGQQNTYDLPISPGDTVELHVTAFSPTSGSVLIRNISNGQQRYQELNGTELCQRDAGWIVDALTDPVPNFSRVIFTGATAGGSDGRLSPSDNGSTVLDMEQSYLKVTNTMILGSDIAVIYGPA